MIYTVYRALFLLTLPGLAFSDNILVVMFFGSKSHRLQFDPLFEELALRGHHLTIVSHSPRFIDNNNITEITGTHPYQIIESLGNPILSRLNGRKQCTVLEAMPAISNACETYLNRTDILDLKRNNFSLVMVDIVGNECSYGLVDYFKAPIIFLSPMPLHSLIGKYFGIPSNPSSVPMTFTDGNFDMNYMDRVVNFIQYTVGDIFFEYIYFNEMERIYRKTFPEARSVREVLSNGSLILLNSHFSFNPPKLTVPGVIETGGIHCRQPKLLPNDIQNFLDSSGPEGFIYFSMGSLIGSQELPEKLINVFNSTFAKLKQRVIWKYEGEIPGISSNVMLRSWVPQQDVLGHKNIRLFITQGGLCSIFEALYHSVPVLGLPVFFDQDENINIVEKSGIGLGLELRYLNEDALLSTVNELIHNPRFAAHTNVLSARFRDRPDTPISTAAYWTEYIIRHKGAPFLHLRSREFCFFKYYCLDIIMPFILLILISGYYLTKKLNIRFRSWLTLKQKLQYYYSLS